MQPQINFISDTISLSLYFGNETYPSGPSPNQSDLASTVTPLETLEDDTGKNERHMNNFEHGLLGWDVSSAVLC